MDFIWLIDTLGEPATAALVGLGLGLAFGGLAFASGFCTRSAVMDVVRKRDGKSLALWLTAFGVAILGTQGLLASGQLGLDETRFFATAQSVSGAIVGGIAFGIGMILTRGCTSRLLVLASSGNLRAWFTIAIIGAVSWATYQGPLVPLRNEIGGWANTMAIGSNDLAYIAGQSNLGVIIGAVLLMLALFAAARSRLSLLRIVQGAALGALIPAGWWLTHQLSLQVFEPIQAESLSFMRPLANTINYAASGGSETYLNSDIGLIVGTIIGALLIAVLTKSVQIQNFGAPGTPSIYRYVLGGILMGFGGILAVGCTIGAGFTGGSALAITSLIGLISMLISAGLTDFLLDKPRDQALPVVPFPAE